MQGYGQRHSASTQNVINENIDCNAHLIPSLHTPQMSNEVQIAEIGVGQVSDKILVAINLPRPFSLLLLLPAFSLPTVARGRGEGSQQRDNT